MIKQSKCICQTISYKEWYLKFKNRRGAFYLKIQYLPATFTVFLASSIGSSKSLLMET